MAKMNFRVIINEPMAHSILCLAGAIIIMILAFFAGFNILVSGLVAGSLILLGTKLSRGKQCPVHPESQDLRGKNVIITGANTGIGLRCALQTYLWGAHVLIACRNEEKANKAVEWVKNQASSVPANKKLEGGTIGQRSLDLSSLESVRKFASEWKEDEPIHILLNNAGVMMCPDSYRTKEGYDLQFGTNHLGHFLLTLLLIDNIKAGKGRVVTVSSLGHSFAPDKIDWKNITNIKEYDATVKYGISKIANIYFTMELNKRLEPSGASAYAVHPGGVRTELSRHIMSSIFEMIFFPFIVYFSKNPMQGAQTSLFCATHPDAAPGQYHSDCGLGVVSKKARDTEEAKRLWKISKELVGLSTDSSSSEE